MADGKRKGAPSGKDGQQSKKKRTGNAGKWKTPHQQTKMAQHAEATVQPGDEGIWVTCARHQEGKAAREVGVLFSEYAEKLYNIKSIHDAPKSAGDNGEEEEEEDDIETAIQKEIATLSAKSTPGTPNTPPQPNQMKPMKMNVDCLLFVKTAAPVDPVAFVRRIAEDARRCEEIPGLMRCRYVNRLTPVSVMGKATEVGLGEVARRFWGEGEKTDTASNEVSEKKPFTFAIRPTIRNHSNLKRDMVINTIAGLINNDHHKVNLTSPDKVILVDIYQSVCGMCVVDGDWDALKRYNLTELYSQARKNAETY
ncbi:hypothetical protein N0V88_006123 [Collariella sp. IMI 366227]|nr:hypothetical protein N0V88_006123 [Collariella sp. IMI 366227]